MTTTTAPKEATMTHAELEAAVSRENAMSALRRAAQHVGELRKCRRCPEEVCIFSKGNRHLVFTAATGTEHAGECIGRTP